MLVIDTETRTTPDQAFLFGFARLLKLEWQEEQGSYTLRGRRLLAEVLIHADGLNSTNPDGYRLLAEFAQEHPRVLLIDRSTFAEQYIRKYCLLRTSAKYGRTMGEATLTGFNLPFDLSRLAYSSGIAQHGNGFTFVMFPPYNGKENRHRPRLTIKSLDSKKTIMSWRSDLNGDELTREQMSMRNGQLLDLRQLIYGMTNKPVTLQKACEMYGVPGKLQPGGYGKITPEFIAYARQDTTATADLAIKVLCDYMRHPVSLQASKVFSAASIAKAYLTKMGVTPMLSRPGIPAGDTMLGHCMSAFYGGRAEAHITRVPLPVTVCDFTSMYPTTGALMKLWDHVTAATLNVRSGDAELQQFSELCADVASSGVPALLDKTTWPKLTGFAKVLSDGDVLPVRAKYGEDTWNVGINELHWSSPAWYTMPDILASCLVTGKVPKILEVTRFEPGSRKLRNLRPVKIGGVVPVDPRHDDFFRVIVEQRATASERDNAMLKTLASAGSYGIYVEMMRDDDTRPERMRAYGVYDHSLDCKSNAVELARKYCYPPVGAIIPGAARLMLAIVERLVSDAGGTWLFCDTDSMAIVTNREGSLIPCPGGSHQMPDGTPAVRALTRQQIQDIRDTVAMLNPYDAAKVPVLLKDETHQANETGQVYGYAISAKRYCLFTYDAAGKPVVPEAIDGKDAFMEHALALYLSPDESAEASSREWIRQTWQYIVDKAHGFRPEMPSWAAAPALSRYAVSTPRIMAGFRRWNQDKSYEAGIKPFNFILLASEFRPSSLDSVVSETEALRLLAPYERNPARWRILPWHDLGQPGREPVRITTGKSGEGKARIKDIWTVLLQFEWHPEPKSAMLDGRACAQGYRGILARRIIRPLSVRHIGKESNRVDEVSQGYMVRESDVFTEYQEMDRPLRALARHAFGDLSAREIARLVNAESDALLTEQKRQSRIEFGPGAAEFQRDYGHPVKVNDKMIGRYFAGSGVRDQRQEQAIMRTAAKRVADECGIMPEDIGYTRQHVNAESVIAVWLSQVEQSYAHQEEAH